MLLIISETKMRLRKWVVCAALMLSAAAFAASDKEIADKLTKEVIKVKLDNGVAMSVLFSDIEMVNFTPTLAQFKLVGQFKQLKSFTVYNSCGATDENFGFIDGLENLETAAINGLKISDEGFKHFANLKNLKKLTLWHVFNNKFNGSGSAHLADLPKLDFYACDGSTFNDEGLKACSKLRQLSTLHFHHTMATDAGVAYLRGMENLKSLMLSAQYSMRLGDAALESTAEIPNLEALEFNETTLTYDGGLKHLKKLRNLKDLILKDDDISEADLAKLREDLPKVNFAFTRAKAEDVAKMKGELAKRGKK